MKTRLLVFILCCCSAWNIQAQGNDEKLLVNETFQSWEALASSVTETSVTKKTDFSNETLVYRLREIEVAPSGVNTDRFDYAVVSAGYLMAAKSATPYIELSPLASITRVEFIHGATGSNRGYQLWKKSAADADWVSVSSAVAGTASGSVVSVVVNETNVALKFTNLNSVQNAYLFDLKIYGNYTSTAPQVHLNTSVNIPGAGSIARSINSDTYDAGTVVSLTATAHFGYRFVKWTNAEGETLADTSQFDITLDTDRTVIAVFEALATYRFNVSIEGSRWGVVKLTPEPVNGQYEAGTMVTAAIVANPVTVFSFWEDGSSETSRTFQVNEDLSIVATFDEIPFIVGWDFVVQEPRTGRSGDYYSESTNTGTISLYKPDGTTVNWLANTGSFNPSYPCIRKWTAGADFDSEQRYYQASFSTEGYTHIRVTSLMGGNYQVHSKQTMQYSIDGTQFTDLTSVDIAGVYNSGWVPCDAILPQEAEGQNKVYIRWKADVASATLGNATDNDGTALTRIFIYADKETAIDTDPPTLLSTSPAEGSSSASASGSIVLTFNERVQAGTGSVTLNGQPIAGTFGSKTATFKYAGLAYNSAYTLMVPAGALQDLSGNAFAGLTLTFNTMNRPQPIARTFDFVVAQDGSGNGTTIQSAFNAAPTDGTPFLVFVKNGRYEERPSLPSNKSHVSLIGQSRENVIVTASVYSGLNGATTSTCQTLEILADHFYMENITVENAAGVNAGQAVALKDYGKYNAYKNIQLLGHQDTHLTGNNSIQYYQRCDIRGTVDFIFGGGDIFFDECLLYCIGRSNGDVITAPSTLASSSWGYVFRECTIDGDPATQNNKYQLGRPWQNAPRAVFINTLMQILPTAAGWTNMGVIPALFAEYNSMNANGEPVDLSNRKSEYTTSADNGSQTVGGRQTVLTDAQAAQYTRQNVTKGSIDWNPLVLTEATAAPVLRGSGGHVVWDKVDYAICYIVIENGTAVSITTENHYPSTGDNAYEVYAVAESGALSELSDPLGLTGITTPQSPEIIHYVRDGRLYFEHLPPQAVIERFNFTGQKTGRYIPTADSYSIEINEHGIVKILSGGQIMVFKI
ncbi:MAG: Ig-like domain-containing protein [Dysgonamonadaceae bacterium]|jgi:pectin methylesterase-like acyl-CoA thioesterase|nr:Ig-like domain-containing protein [Dysgonamonadaceae bacterium]